MMAYEGSPISSKSPRPYGLSKIDCIRVTYKSILEGLTDIPHKFTIISDHVSDELLSEFESAAIVHNTKGGVHEGRKLSYELAKTVPDNELVYFVEDDYVHADDWAWHICDLYNNKSKYLQIHHNSHLFIHTPDYIDRYYPKPWNDIGLEAKFHIFASPYIHWRQIYNATQTFLFQAYMLNEYKDAFERGVIGNDSSVFSKLVYRNSGALCLSPIPGLSHHLDGDVLPAPGEDWEVLTKDYL